MSKRRARPYQDAKKKQAQDRAAEARKAEEQALKAAPKEVLRVRL